MTPVLVANWKMNMAHQDASRIAKEIDAAHEQFAGVDVVLCPSFTELTALADLQHVRIGVQNFYPLDKGSVTGEVPVSTVKDLATYAIIGHSERREILAEDNEIIAKKVAAALEHDITPILCVGETWEQRKKGAIARVLHEQLRNVLPLVARFSEKKFIVTYEPVWAINNHRESKPATPRDVQDATTLLHGIFHEHHFDAKNTQILYGGSVDANNAASFFSMSDIAGALVGTASLTSASFIQIATQLSKEKHVR